MLTTAANAEVEPVNDRMPLVLTSEAQYARWLDPEISTRAPLQSALQPIGDGVLRPSRPPFRRPSEWL